MKVSDLNFCEITFQSPAYKAAVQLRERLLRQPLHLQFEADQLASEWQDYHLVAIDEEEKVVACVVLSPKEEEIKMRQLAVTEAWQGHGIGRGLVEFAESFARAKEYATIFCHARSQVVPFYEKMGYQAHGAPFEEVTIQHYYMEKRL